MRLHPDPIVVEAMRERWAGSAPVQRDFRAARVAHRALSAGSIEGFDSRAFADGRQDLVRRDVEKKPGAGTAIGTQTAEKARQTTTSCGSARWSRQGGAEEPG